MPPQAKERFSRLLEKRLANSSLLTDWAEVKSPSDSLLLPYEKLQKPGESTDLKNHSKLVVLKLNGGLGTSMGCQGPKSAIKVKNGKSFLELIGEQIRHLQSKASVTLALMNSFHTHSETLDLVKTFSGKIPLNCFQQNRFPRLYEKSMEPLHPETFGDEVWYPPGHGDLYACLEEQGLLDQWLSEGREVLFVSNADNLGAVVDESILHHMILNEIPFLMELTPKTSADLKGGTVFQEGDRLRLLEIGNVPPKHVAEFQGMGKFKVFNTNNIWIHLRKLKERLLKGPMDLPVISNIKTVKGERVVQLETAVGAGLESFKGSIGLVVPRTRFAPVKTTSDLLRVQSDIYLETNGMMIPSPKRTLKNPPQISLKGPLEDTQELLTRIPEAPGMIDLQCLEIKGDVSFKGKVVFKGTVRLNGEKMPLEIPSGVVLDNCRLGDS